MIRAALALLLLASPALAQTRAGLCVLNIGQMVPEVYTHVRSGNMGWEYSCYTVAASIGGRWDVALTVSPTWLTVWERTGDISRWSWRPEGRTNQAPFVWTWPEVGYRIPAGPLEVRPAVGVLWPTSTSYGPWGAPVGFNPSAGADLALRVGKLWLAIRPRVVWKRPTGWTVLYDFTVIEQPTPHVEYWMTPVSVALGLEF